MHPQKILYVYHVKLSKLLFNGLLSCFSVLLLGRNLTMDEFVSTSTAPKIIDNHYRALEDLKFYGGSGRSKHGAYIIAGRISDDTVQGDKKKGKTHAINTIRAPPLRGESTQPAIIIDSLLVPL